MSFNERLTKAREDIRNEANEREQTRKKLTAEQERKDCEEVQRQLSIRSLPEFQQMLSFATDPELSAALLSYWKHFRPSREKKRLFQVYQEVPNHYIKQTCLFPQGSNINRDEYSITAKVITRLYHDAWNRESDSVYLDGNYYRYSGMVYLEMVLTEEMQISFKLLSGVGGGQYPDGDYWHFFDTFQQYEEVLDRIALSIASSKPLWTYTKWLSFPFPDYLREQPL